MSQNNDYTTINLLDYEYFGNHYKIITIENPDLKQKINFNGKLEEDNGAIMLFIIRKSKKLFLVFHKIL